MRAFHKMDITDLEANEEKFGEAVAGRRQQPKKRIQGDDRSRKKLAVARRRMTPRADPAPYK
jgi:hypothetical protein